MDSTNSSVKQRPIATIRVESSGKPVQGLIEISGGDDAWHDTARHTMENIGDWPGNGTKLIPCDKMSYCGDGCAVIESTPKQFARCLARIITDLLADGFDVHISPYVEPPHDPACECEEFSQK